MLANGLAEAVTTGRSPDRQMLDSLFTELREQLRRKASALCRRERSPSFATGDLINGVYLRLSRNPAYYVAIAERGRLDFMCIAAEAMRHVLTDAARKRLADKRGGSFAFVSLSHAEEKSEMSISPEALLDLDDALRILEEKHPRRAAILKMRFYSGLTIRELQEYWGLADATVERDIHLALKLLYTLLQSEQE